RQTDTTAAKYINGLRSKDGKVRSSAAAITGCYYNHATAGTTGGNGTAAPLPGFVLCSLDTHDGMCRNLCGGAGCVVASVDYRLAPEHKFPAAIEDSLHATRWAAVHAAELGASPGRIVVAGDSAGANVAAVA